MARPIEETPVLTRREWRKFEAQLYANRNKMITAEEYAEMKKNYEFIASLFVENNPKTKKVQPDEPEHS
ncbi:hypothetical protein SAMN04487996_113170 [Dyadobacter soli]|uniref:Uncharacterized protein n=1 Tax=Dyadobacter soli TaxID=659014 RepID=A0A1G7PZW2_9BACT|nr:hypothetical protein [Dyadobacter soli]SDF91219.1 hypothetical protein SAMN04487996_113170 [Dyadobacter soli]